MCYRRPVSINISSILRNIGNQPLGSAALALRVAEDDENYILADFSEQLLLIQPFVTHSDGHTALCGLARLSLAGEDQKNKLNKSDITNLRGLVLLSTFVTLMQGVPLSLI